MPCERQEPQGPEYPKLETLDGALQDQDDDDMVRIWNNRLIQEEHDKASAADRVIDECKGGRDFTLRNSKQLEEDLWYTFNEKLEGTDPQEAN